MKTPTIVAHVTNLNNRHIKYPTSRISTANKSSMILSEIHDKEILLLPEIQLPDARNSVSGAARRGGPASRSFKEPSKLTTDLKVDDSLNRSLSRSLIDIREESFDSDRSYSPNLCRQGSKDAESVNTNTKVNENIVGLFPTVNVVKTPTLSPKLLTGREDKERSSIRSSSSASSSQTNVRKLGTASMLAPVDKHRPYLKSHSQREFSFEERENLLPSIAKKSSSQRQLAFEERECKPFPKSVPPIPNRLLTNTSRSNSREFTNPAAASSNRTITSIGATPNNDPTTSIEGITAAPRPSATNTGAKPRSGRTLTRLSPRTRSSSVMSIFPCSLPSILSRSKSTSQPDISKHSSPPFPPSSSTLDLLACNPAVAKKQRVRKLWRRVGEKLGLRQEDPNGDDGSIASWARGPGDLLRPVYSRWLERRYALAEPERMCMPQDVRERIQKDVQTRKRSLKRRVSNFLTVKLGLDMEEDLAA